MNKRHAAAALLLSATLISTYATAASWRHVARSSRSMQSHSAPLHAKEETALIGHRFDVGDMHVSEVTTAGLFVGMSYSKHGYAVFTAGPKQDVTSQLWLTRPVATHQDGEENVTTYEILDAIDAHARPGEYLVPCQDDRGNENYAAYANLTNVLLARDENGKEISFDEQINPRVVWEVQGHKLVPVKYFLHSVRCINNGQQ